MEILDIYDDNQRHTGTMPRDEVHRRGEWHRTIHCWIVCPKGAGSLLFQRRGGEKELYPDLLDVTAAGHYMAGETPEEGVREVREELGIAVEFGELRPLGIRIETAAAAGLINREFADVYLLERSDSLTDYSPPTDEVRGLLRIAISDGLRLFSRKTIGIPASWTEWNAAAGQWRETSGSVSLDAFLPRLPSYYMTILIMAERHLHGEQFLSI